MEREGRKDHDPDGNPESLHSVDRPRKTSARRVPPSAHTEERQTPGQQNLWKAGICVSGPSFSLSLKATENKLQKCHSDLGFPTSKCCFRWATVMPKGKIKAVFHKARWILKFGYR